MRNFIIFSLVVVYSNIFAQNKKHYSKSKFIEYHRLFHKGMKKGVAAYRIPALVTAVNGDLIAIVDERVPSRDDLKSNMDINILIRRSVDNGKSWSESKTIIDYPFGQSASDPSMIVDQITGEIYLFFNYMDLVNENDVIYLKLIKSRDNGKTWTLPEDITAQIEKTEWHNNYKFITSGRGIQTSSGQLLHCLVNIEHNLHIFGSNNHGKTWFLIDTPIKHANESKILELADDSWMVNSRIVKGGVRYVHTSLDQGKTWCSKPDSTLIDPGCNASFIRYSSIKDGSDKNRLLFSNANNKKRRKNMTVRLSYDEGKTWTKGKTIHPGWSAYSSLSVLKNGNIALLFEKDHYRDIVFVTFSLDWLTDNKDTYPQLPLDEK